MCVYNIHPSPFSINMYIYIFIYTHYNLYSTNVACVLVQRNASMVGNAPLSLRQLEHFLLNLVWALFDSSFACEAPRCSAIMDGSEYVEQDVRLGITMQGCFTERHVLQMLKGGFS